MANPLSRARQSLRGWGKSWKAGQHILIAVALFGLILGLGTNHYYLERGKGTPLCRDAEPNRKSQCWRDALWAALRTRGVDAAFQTVADLYEAESSFPEVCYELTRRLGERAFEHYQTEYEHLITSPKTIFCNYGFYHAFAEALLRSNADLNKAQAFCTYVGRQLADQSPGVILECYRGLGRGAVGILEDSQGKERKIAALALERCEAMAVTEDERAVCVSGVFNRLAIAYVRGEGGLSINKEDPLWLCHQQDEHYKGRCYGNMHRVLLASLDEKRSSDIQTAVTSLVHLYGVNEAVFLAVHKLAYDRALTNLTRADHAESISICHALPHPFSRPCIKGYALGLAKNGKPGQQFIAVLDFCHQSLLSPEEEFDCFEFTLPYLRGLYPREKFKTICNMVAKPYSELCAEPQTMQ